MNTTKSIYKMLDTFSGKEPDEMTEDDMERYRDNVDFLRKQRKEDGMVEWFDNLTDEEKEEIDRMYEEKMEDQPWDEITEKERGW